MSGIIVAYATGAGHTRLLAELIADAAGGGVMDVEKMAAPDWQALHKAEAIIFGAPTYMGSVSAGFKSFMDASSDFWIDQLWLNKVAAGFTVGSSPSGDKVNSLVTMVTFAAQHGMIWVGQSEIGPPSAPENAGINMDGFNLGLGATSVRDKTQMIGEGDRETARRFGVRIAMAVQRWD